MKNFFHEFKEFAVKGNALDLAVGVVIGAAFNNIVNSIVNDIINPIISLLTGRVDFTNRFFVIEGAGNFETLAEAKAAGVVTLNYGLFINNLIQFVIVAMVLFMIVKQLNRFRRHHEAEQQKDKK